jgi:hypothetical protein
MRGGALVVLAGIASFIPSFAAAQTVRPNPELEIVAATRGMSKGLAQTDGPQLLLRGEIAFGSLFLAAYGKNVVSSGQAGTESGLLVGARLNWRGFSLLASAAYKRLDGIGGPLDHEALEVVLGASRRLGPLTGRAAVTFSPDELGSTRRSLLLEAGLGADLGHGFTMSGAVGRRVRAGGPDYTAFNLGFSKALGGGFTADLRVYDTAQSGLGEIYRGRLVASLRARF